MIDPVHVFKSQSQNILRKPIIKNRFLPFIVLALIGIVIFGCNSEPDVSRSGGHAQTPVNADSNTFWIHDKKAPLPKAISNDYAGSLRCKECHREIYQAYMNHPMANSIRKLGEQTPLEDYLENVHFQAGGFDYEIRSEGNSTTTPPRSVEHVERLISTSGETVLEQSVPMHYVVGSGSRGRSFLQQKGQRLFQSPITWYVEKELWDLSPGYMPANHQRFDRTILDKCIACHAGLVNRIDQKPHHFDSQNPFREMGISCERCHGPAEKHVQGHLKQSITTDQFVVNPAVLPRPEKESICNQCHLAGKLRVARFGKSFFDFRPGMKLDDAWTVFTNAQVALHDGSAQILSHVEQMHASQCYLASKEQMGCTNCHDPHRSPATQDKVGFYRGKCLQCHTAPETICSEALPIRQQTNGDSCFACHMPRIANSDIAHSTQSDHRVLRDPEMLEYNNSSTVMKKDYDSKPWILFQNSETRIPSWEADRAGGEALLAQFSTVKDIQLLNMAEEKLQSAARHVSNDSQLLLNLGRVYSLQNKHSRAIAVLQSSLELNPHDASAISLLALCYDQQNNDAAGVALYPAWQAQSYQPPMEYGLFANMFYRQGDHQKAIKLLQESLTLNPTLTLHHRSLSIIQSRIGAIPESRQSLQKANLIESLIQPYIPKGPGAKP